jgi:hypothetical protein
MLNGVTEYILLVQVQSIHNLDSRSQNKRQEISELQNLPVAYLDE